MITVFAVNAVQGNGEMKMTKFEEEAMKEFDSSEYVYTAYDGTFRGETDGTVMEFAKGNAIYTFPWLEFAKSWHSDEKYQELLKKNNKLKSQLQQQALPVVPEYVDIWIKKCQELNWMITDVLAPESWSSDFDKDTENWLKKSKENFNLLALAFITGKYQVEKPQLFYLKNKLTGDCLAICLARASSGLYVEVTEKWLTRKEQTSYRLYFTQSEIDSMETGSYELVPVEDGE